VTYADGGEERVYDHLRRILDFSAEQVGQNGICKGLRADWNDCLNLGGGESAMVSFLHYWALNQFIPLARTLGRDADAARYAAMAERVKDVCERVLWDGSWYIRGITADNRKIGTHTDEEGKVHLESNAWAVLSGAASKERGEQALASVKEYLFTPYGLMLNAPPYTRPDDGIGFVTRVYPGLKENGAIFSHPNPWAWGAACALGDGETAMAFYDALCPYNQNDKIEIRQAEPYTYCQFVVGRAHTAYGRARHPFITGSAGWSYFAATEYILGVRPDYDRLIVDPCIPPEWKGFSVSRAWRGAVYDIHVENPSGVSRGVKSLLVDGAPAETIPPLPAGARCRGTSNSDTVSSGFGMLRSLAILSRRKEYGHGQAFGARRFPQARLIALIGVCWVLPVMLILALSGYFIRNNLQSRIDDTIDTSVTNALNLTRASVDSALSASRAASYDNVIQRAWTQYIEDRDGVALYASVTEYLSQQYSYDENFRGVMLYFVSDPSTIYYASNRSNMGKTDPIRNYRAYAHEMARSLSKEAGTQVRFFEADGALYMLRNIVDSAFSLTRSS
jgi:hypothetical protein